MEAEKNTDFLDEVQKKVRVRGAVVGWGFNCKAKNMHLLKVSFLLSTMLEHLSCFALAFGVHCVTKNARATGRSCTNPRRRRAMLAVK